MTKYQTNHPDFYLEYEQFTTKSGCWEKTSVSIYDKGKIVGGYERGYGSLFDTFWVFQQGEDTYALYSADYTTTRVLKMVGGQFVDWCGEEGDSLGFCPTGFYVPGFGDDTDELKPWMGTFGFVCGCVWGDDSAWKIQFLDLSRLSEKILVRDDRLGYIELLGDSDGLPDAIDVSDYSPEDGFHEIRIACAHWFDLRELK